MHPSLKKHHGSLALADWVEWRHHVVSSITKIACSVLFITYVVMCTWLLLRIAFIFQCPAFLFFIFSFCQHNLPCQAVLTFPPWPLAFLSINLFSWKGQEYLCGSRCWLEALFKVAQRFRAEPGRVSNQ